VITSALRALRGPGFRVLSLMMILALATALAACGKKGPPEPPAGEETSYPRTYPSR